MNGAGYEWVPFYPESSQPPERRYVLLAIASRAAEGGEPEVPTSVAVGWLRIDSGGPYFVVPGMRARPLVAYWCDCLGDDFYSPLWEAGQMDVSPSQKRAWQETPRAHDLKARIEALEARVAELEGLR